MKYFFVGNRRFVLEELLKRNLCVDIFVISDSHLHKELLTNDLKFKVIKSKSELILEIKNSDFDILISNGCPYILPIESLPPKKYINIHPSCLPDLRGIDPVIGAILHQRDSGATCHYMDKGVDTGDIISQVRIPYSVDLDVSLLYQMSFQAEKETLKLALDRSFERLSPQSYTGSEIYYSRKPQDQKITFVEPNQTILNKVRAFNNKSQGCQFLVNGEPFKVYSARILQNRWLVDYCKSFNELEVIFSYEGGLIFKKDTEVIHFSSITGKIAQIGIGSKLGTI